MVSATVGSGSIIGGWTLRPGADTVTRGDLHWRDSILQPDPEPSPNHDGHGGTAPVVIDAADAWVLPGVIDLHGDAFERAVMPRAGVYVDLDLALADNATQLLASGVTTAYLSATDSWEPGLRSRQMLRSLVDALKRSRLGPEHRLHVRHERCSREDPDELAEWVRDGTVQLLSFNDHTPGGIAMVRGISETQVQRTGVDRTGLERLLAGAVEHRSHGQREEQRLAGIAAEVGCPTASHDSSGDEDFERDLALGIRMAEFPMSIALGQRYHGHGIDVLLGAPNLVRGGSHLGNLSVRASIEAGVGSLLCSDYHYPSLLQAPFVLDALGLCSFGAAWSMVSATPALVAGLDDRGRLLPGARADIIVVDPPGPPGSPARVRAVVRAGQVVFEAPMAEAR